MRERVAKVLGLMKRHKLMMATVVLPTLISVLYFGLIASDVYVSESRFVVRSPDRQMPSSLGLILKGAGFSRSQDDSYSVQEFMLSRDALRALDAKLGVRRAFSNNGIDIFSRFAGLGWDDSFEELYRYYQKKVDIQLDSMSSIATLTTRAFSADDAYHINQQLLVMAEALINKLNERARQDMIRFASAEVEEAETRAKNAALALSAFRSQKSVIDPERQSAVQLQQIAKLQDQLIATQTQLAQLEAFSKDNPQIPAVQKRLETLRGAISAEDARVTGGERSLAGKAVDFQRLSLEREFADKQLALTLASLQEARNDAQRKQLYLERIAEPSKPDIAMEPRRLRAILTTLVLGLIVWGIATILIAGVREHQD